MKRICLYVLVGCIAFALAGATAWAQTTAQISGTVKDQSGAVLPGVEVSATQTATGAKRTTVTNETGNYALASLPIGPYMLDASLPGFKSYVQSGIVLQIDESPIINVVLQVGQVSEQVEVQANAGLVETQRTAIGQVVTNKQIAELPLNGRDPHELIFLAGMALAPGIGSMNSIRNYPTVVVSVAGGNGDGVSYLLDGSIWQDPYNSLSMPLPFPDALQEFKVETSAMQAQYGFHATAAVNAVTRSGSNEFHGDLFEFVRNYKFNARDAFAKQRDTYKRNQFGGVIGGPIKKDKLFFFGGYQRTSLRSDGVQNTAFIPTQAAEPQPGRDAGIAALADAHVPVAVKVSVTRLDPVAVTVLLPGLGPSVKVTSASPLALVFTLTWDAPMLPPPEATRNVTWTPATGRPAASTTRTVNALGRTVPRGAVWPFPRTIREAVSGDPLARGVVFQPLASTLPIKLSPVAVTSASPRGPRPSPHHACESVILEPVSLRAPPCALSKMSLSRALKLATAPNRIPMTLVERKFESTRMLTTPPSTRTPALNAWPVTVFCTTVIDGATACSAACATSVSPGTGLNPAPNTLLPIAVKLAPEKRTEARFSTKVDCWTRKEPLSTATA